MVSLSKAKEPWRKSIEWWIQFLKWWKDVALWVTGALFETLLSMWYRIVWKIHEKKLEEPGLNECVKQQYMADAKKYNISAKEHVIGAWYFGKQATLWLCEALKWWGKTLRYGGEAGYYLADALYDAVRKTLKENQINMWTIRWKVLELINPQPSLVYSWCKPNTGPRRMNNK